MIIVVGVISCCCSCHSQSCGYRAGVPPTTVPQIWRSICDTTTTTTTTTKYNYYNACNEKDRGCIR